MCKVLSSYTDIRVRVGSVSLKSLVKIPFSKWKDAVEIFRNHEITEYHKMAVLRAQNRLAITEKKTNFDRFANRFCFKTTNTRESFKIVAHS